LENSDVRKNFTFLHYDFNKTVKMQHFSKNYLYLVGYPNPNPNAFPVELTAKG